MKLFMLLLFSILFSSCNSSSTHSNDSLNYEDSLKLVQQKNEIPGLGAASIINSELEINTTGVKRIETNSPLNANDSFHLGSCSKAMTATLAAILIEEGTFNWTSKLTDLLPAINLHPEFVDATFEMILSHRTGLANDGPSNFSNDWLFQALQNPSLTEIQARLLYAENILTLKPQSPPGSKFNYSNGGYILAAHIMEVLTGQSWESLIQEKLFNPLDMNSCGTGPTWGHYRNSQKIYSLYSDNPPAYSPASGIHCSLADWGKFLTQHLRGFKGEAGIVNAESFKKLHTVSANDGHNYTYGGWGKVSLNWAGGSVLTHNGSNTLNYAQVWIAPDKDAVFMVATNIAGTQATDATNEIVSKMINQKL
jgi:CubicO group peptidase (beta-lactamase class C family)